MKINKYEFWSQWRERTKITEKQINEAFSRLYKGEKPTVLLKELSIDRDYNRSFIEHFPPIFCNSLCRLCGFHLYAYRSDRNHYRKTLLPYDILTAHCLKCGHQENMNCECLDCHLRECENQKVIEHNQKLIEELESDWIVRYKNTVLKTSNQSFSKLHFKGQHPSLQLKHRDIVAISKNFLFINRNI
jgi:hypothetical protein